MAARNLELLAAGAALRHIEAEAGQVHCAPLPCKPAPATMRSSSRSGVS
jgi:hypothetical protein